MNSTRILVASLMILCVAAISQGAVLFSANYDNTFDAQTTVGASPTPYVYEGGSNPVSLSGGGLLTPDSKDSLFYMLGLNPETHPDWAPVNGKVTVNYTLPTTISSSASMQLVGFYYTYPDLASAAYATYSYSTVWLNTDPAYGFNANIRAHGFYGGSSSDYGNGWTPNTVMTAGSHTMEWSWERFSPGSPTNTENDVHMVVKFDGNTYIDAYDQTFGWPSVALDGLLVGGYRWVSGAGYANDSIGAFGGTIDSVVIESVVPEPCTIALLSIGALGLLRKRK